jgi:HSP20 family molecular chaperone IbpA
VRRYAEWSPSVDITETKDNILNKAELPGLDTKDVNVSISGNVLTISYKAIGSGGGQMQLRKIDRLHMVFRPL